MKRTYLFICLITLSGCETWNAAFGNHNALDPTERGLSYVATAIVVSAIIRLLH